ncbi:MAG: arginine--tRNA ligase, partial [Microgenomates group bacterium]
MIRDKIREAIEETTGEKEIPLEFPENEEYGDYATNIALISAKKKNKNPHELAKKIVEKLQKDKKLAKMVSIEVAGPGFINFSLSKDILRRILKTILEKKEDYGKTEFLKDKKYLLEHTSPNTIKTLHVGHVRNNILGMAMHDILESVGARVKLDAINNDRGIHVMKAVWAYQKYGKDKTPKSEKMKPDHFVDKFYIKGAKEAEDPKIKEEMQELLRKWEAGDEKVHAVWKKLRNWTLEGFLETYKRLGSNHDYQWFESDFYQEGKKIIKDGLRKKVFKKLPDGAVLSQLGKFGLTDTIVLRADGTSMYHTQDLYLTRLKREKFPSDLYIWDIGPEQSLYLKQLFAMCEQLGIGKREDYMHLSYGYVFLKGKGKMSSRKGNVISADWLMNEMVKRA